MSRSIWTYVVLGVPVVGLAVLLFSPSTPVVDGMAIPDTSSLEVGDTIAEVIIPASLSQNAQIGKTAFEGACSACHGVNADGKKGFAPPLVHVTYEPGHHGDEAFWRATQNGVQSHHWDFGNMPQIEGLTRSDVNYIVAYVRELQQANGIN
tara:strand:- start:12950 stop:13402 length:453 start_codon:yes stop_codon:yes gene_type:complete